MEVAALALIVGGERRRTAFLHADAMLCAPPIRIAAELELVLVGVRNGVVGAVEFDDLVDGHPYNPS